MKNHELAAEFADCLPQAKVLIVNPGIDGTDHERFGIGKVTFLVGSNPLDTIIEATREHNDAGSITVEEFLNGLADIRSPDGDAQVYVEEWEGQGYAYFDVAEVRRGPYLHSVILGDWRCGG